MSRVGAQAILNGFVACYHLRLDRYSDTIRCRSASDYINPGPLQNGFASATLGVSESLDRDLFEA